MHIAVISDVHLEFRDICWSLVPGWIEKQKSLVGARNIDVLCVCGDICPVATHGESYKDFLTRCSDLATHVLVVLGNHECYGSSSVFEALKTARKLAAGLSNVRILECETVEIDGVYFHGATLWSRIDVVHHTALKLLVNDYIHIGGFKPETSTMLFQMTYKWLQKEMMESEKRHVVLTHHLPTFALIDPKYSNASPMNQCYATEIVGSILPDVWMCGHSHQRTTYISEDGVLCIMNCRGYPNETNDDHNLFRIFSL
jgi:predicted phosphodiesterase